jgi:Na+-transporting methylmalonyl-CoA/oxaloacetate decarboxylase gamma subunit
MLQSRKFKFGLNFWGLALLILVIFLLISLVYLIVKSAKLMNGTEPDEETETETETETKPEPLTAQNNPIPIFYKKVLATVPELDEKMKVFITAQAMHETGIFTSPLYLNHNNAYGMNMPSKRKTTAIGQTESGFAIYDSVEDSIKDLMLYFEEFNAPDTFANSLDYVTWIKSNGYFTDSLKTYSNGVAKHLVKVLPFAQ